MPAPSNASNMMLTDVDLLSPTDGWAVGHHSKGSPRPLTAHWDGTEWRVVTDRDSGPSGWSLNSVAARSSDDVWAVGYREASLNRFAPLAQHWDGSGWEDVPIASTGDSDVLIDADSDLSGVWAVGFSLTGSRYSPLVQRWDGSAWVAAPTPSLGSDSGVLLAVHSRGPLDAWAVGYRMNRWKYETLIQQWDGQTWSIVPSPSPPGNHAVLTGVAGSVGDAWAVGYSASGSAYRTLALRWDGSQWVIVPTTNPHPRFSVFRDVIAGVGTGVWAVGMKQRGTEYAPLLEHWDGQNWILKDVEGKSKVLFAASALPTGHAVSVGGRGRPVIIGTCFDAQAAPAEQSSRSDRELNHDRSVSSRGSSKEEARANGEIVSSDGATITVVDETIPAGISEKTTTWGAAITDLNDDGWDDFFLGRHGEAGRLYRNEGGRFVEVAPGTFRASDRHGCVWIDWNGDDLDDLYCALGGGRGYGVESNELWTQRADGGFTDQGATVGAADPFGRGREAITLDANGDGLPDLFVANLETRLDGLPTPNRLFINTGKGFRMAPWFGLDVEDGSICTKDGDFNNDGLMDLLLCSRLSGLRIYENAGTDRFVDVSSRMRIPYHRNVRDAVFADLNADDALDLAVVMPARLVVRSQVDGAFKAVFRFPLAHGAAIASGDVNGDGYADLYIVQRGMARNLPDVLLLNDGTGKHYSEIALPQATDGTGGQVVSFDYNRNGHADFIVLNGYHSAGPIQLLSSYSA